MSTICPSFCSGLICKSKMCTMITVRWKPQANMLISWKPTDHNINWRNPSVWANCFESNVKQTSCTAKIFSWITKTHWIFRALGMELLSIQICSLGMTEILRPLCSATTFEITCTVSALSPFTQHSWLTLLLHWLEPTVYTLGFSLALSYCIKCCTRTPWYLFL